MTQEATTHHDATKAPPKAPVYTDEHPEFPKLLYNHATRKTKPAKDKEEEDKLSQEEFVEDPFTPAEEILSDAEVQQLETLMLKVLAAAKTLAKFGKALEQEKGKDNGKGNDAKPDSKHDAKTVTPPVKR